LGACCPHPPILGACCPQPPPKFCSPMFYPPFFFLMISSPHIRYIIFKNFLRGILSFHNKKKINNS
jgi:hypothetical protein